MQTTDAMNDLLFVIDKIGSVLQTNGHGINQGVEHVRKCDLCLGMYQAWKMMAAWEKRYKGNNDI